jgi:hypothetical protein
MRLRHERIATDQPSVRSNPVTKTNTIPFRAPLLASLSLAVLMVGCAKNKQETNEANTVQATSQSEAPNKPMANPFLGLQDDGPFFEPVCQAPEKESAKSSAPKTFPDALTSLYQSGFDGAADALEARVNQTGKKMKIDEERAVVMANHILNNLPNMSKASELEKLMPKSVVELVVAVEERGVSQEEAEKIADFLLRFTSAMRFQNLKQFDSNLSNVIGREWSEIDYSGEGTTWKQRMKQWAKYGVVSFKKAEYIENYFKHEKELGYFSKIYRPEGQWP